MQLKLAFFISLCLFSHFLFAQNHKPEFLGPNNYTTVAGEKACIIRHTFDQDPGDNLTIGWDSLPPNSQIKTNNGTVKQPSMEFCWYTDSSLASFDPYLIPIWVVDNSQPAPDTGYYTLSIRIFGIPALLNYELKEEDCGSLKIKGEVNDWTTKFSCFVRDLSSGDMVGSSTSADTSLQLYPGRFVLITSLRNDVPVQINRMDTLEIKEGASFAVIGPNRVCRNRPLNMNAHLLTGTPPFSYRWQIWKAIAFEDTPIGDSTALFFITEDTRFRCRITDSSGCVYEIEHFVEFDDCVGLEEAGSELTVYPNPAKNQLFISNPEELETEWQLINPFGAQVKSKGMNAAPEQIIDLSQMPAGMYILLIRSSNGQTIRHKIIRQ